MIVRKLSKGGIGIASDSSGRLRVQYFVRGNVDEATVLLAVDSTTGVAIPQKGDPKSGTGYSGMIVDDVEAEWVGGAEGDNQFVVDVTYVAAIFAPGTLSETTPALRYRRTSRYEQIQTAVDCDGNALLNAAGDPPEGGSTGYIIVDVLTVLQRANSFSEATRKNVLGKVNSVAMTVLGQAIDKRQMLCTTYEPLDEITIGVSAPITIQHVYEIRGGFMPHDHQFINAGFNGWFDDAGTAKRGQFYSVAADATDPVNTPVLLRATGRPMLVNDFKVGRAKKANVNNPTIGTITAPSFVGDSANTGWMTYNINAAGNATIAYGKRHQSYDFRSLLPDIFG